MLPSSSSGHENGPRAAHVAIISEKQRARLRLLFPDLSEDDLTEVAEMIHGYCAAAWHIYERLKRERPEVIDALRKNRTMEGKVDSSK